MSMAATLPATRRRLLSDLRGLGVVDGDAVMVHAAVRSIGPILGGVTTLVQALLDAIGERGTLLAYVDWELGYDPDAIDPQLADDVPVFDERIARAARDNGILAEVVRTWPGAVRSDNPDAGVAAVGSRAAWLCAGHALSYGYGAESPFAKLIAIRAKVLVLGAPLDTITLLHHAEHVARLPGKRVVRYRRKLLVDGAPAWVEIEEFDTANPVVEGLPDDFFAQIAAAALDAGCGCRGTVGRAVSYAFEAPLLHRVGVRWLERR